MISYDSIWFHMIPHDSTSDHRVNLETFTSRLTRPCIKGPTGHQGGRTAAPLTAMQHWCWKLSRVPITSLAEGSWYKVAVELPKFRFRQTDNSVYYDHSKTSILYMDPRTIPRFIYWMLSCNCMIYMPTKLPLRACFVCWKSAWFLIVVNQPCWGCQRSLNIT